MTWYFFSACLLTRAFFFYSICTFWKNYCKHFVFYRAKTITKINGRNLTAICLANVSVCDCFLSLSIYCIVCLYFVVVFSFLFLLSILWYFTKHSIISFIRFGSLLLFFVYWVFWCICVVCVWVSAMYDVRCFNLIDGIHCVCSQYKLSKYFTIYCSLIWWVFLCHSLSFLYQSRSTETNQFR